VQPLFRVEHPENDQHNKSFPTGLFDATSTKCAFSYKWQRDTVPIAWMQQSTSCGANGFWPDSVMFGCGCSSKCARPFFTCGCADLFSEQHFSESLLPSCDRAGSELLCGGNPAFSIVHFPSGAYNAATTRPLNCAEACLLGKALESRAIASCDARA